ncbi:hypothetical protein CEY12_06060 [Chryseobacterium sp. T16E-39]|nr:hypothetical protein CEY12_06060 [Chryseobacterium sp. T16E-39]
MAFIYKGIEYYIGSYASKFTISIPMIKNYFKEVEAKKSDYAHNIAQTIIEDELSRISKEKNKSPYT